MRKPKICSSAFCARSRRELIGSASVARVIRETLVGADVQNHRPVHHAGVGTSRTASKASPMTRVARIRLSSKVLSVSQSSPVGTMPYSGMVIGGIVFRCALSKASVEATSMASVVAPPPP